MNDEGAPTGDKQFYGDPAVSEEKEMICIILLPINSLSGLVRSMIGTPQKKLEINPRLQLFMKFQKLLRLPNINKVVFIKPDHSASFRLYVFDAKN